MAVMKIIDNLGCLLFTDEEEEDEDDGWLG